MSHQICRIEGRGLGDLGVVGSQNWGCGEGNSGRYTEKLMNVTVHENHLGIRLAGLAN